jgi:hypothetical protein
MSMQSVIMMTAVIGFYLSGFIYLINLAFNKKEA